jgi:hypothetical protein
MKNQLSLFNQIETKINKKEILELKVSWWVTIQTNKNFYTKYRVWNNENLTDKMQFFKDFHNEIVLWYNAVKA